MQLLLFPLVQRFHMLVETHALEEIPFPISLSPVSNFCDQQALGSGQATVFLYLSWQYLLFLFCFSCRAFLALSSAFTRAVMPNTLATDVVRFLMMQPC